MTASGWRSDPDRPNDARARYRQYSDRALVEAMRSLDADALAEFVERFQHLVLLRARRLRVPPEERKGWAAELLYDVAVSLCRQRHGSAPRALVPYLATACKRKAFAAKRNLAVRERAEAGLMDELGGIGETALLPTCSEDAVRGTYGPGWEPAPLPPVLERLVSAFEEGVSGEERDLLSFVSQRMPYSWIARKLGVSRPAAIKRVTRLRARLIDAAMRFGDVLDRADRIELMRFLRRSGSYTEAELAELSESPGAGVSNHRDGKVKRPTDGEESKRDSE